MTLRSLPALFMRGGTSNGLVFDINDLPRNRADWDRIFLAAMGSPDPNGRQLDGMGGGVSSLSKVCIVGPPTCPDADIDYTFAQVSIRSASVDYAGNCGNMLSAMGPAALELGYIKSDGPTARIRIHNTNTSRIILASFQIEDGRLASSGDMAIDGVSGTAAPIRLEFLEPGGSKTGRLLPTGQAMDRLKLSDGTEINATLVDAANPCVFVSAADMGKTGSERPDELQADLAFMESMEAIRQAGSVAMGMAADLARAKRLASIPKVAIVAEPAPAGTSELPSSCGSDCNLQVRMISMEQPHRAVPITGAICLGIACRIEGSIPNKLARLKDGPIKIAHPAGSVLVDAETETVDGNVHARSGTVFRTARLLFRGSVFFN